MRLAVIGCGAIGSVVANAVAEGTVRAELVAVMDLARERCIEMLSEADLDARVAATLEELLEAKPQLVVEAASQEAVREYGPRILREADLVVMSVGALMDEPTREALRRAALESGHVVYVPSGALVGVDAVSAHKLIGVEEAVLVTRKDPRKLGLPPTESGVVFEGPASEAVKRYPFSVNVAATLSLAAGVEAKVRVVAEPGLERNVHEIHVRGPAGEVHGVAVNVPSPRNPRTSLLAALSLVELLRRLTRSDWLFIGT